MGKRRKILKPKGRTPRQLPGLGKKWYWVKDSRYRHNGYWIAKLRY